MSGKTSVYSPKPSKVDNVKLKIFNLLSLRRREDKRFNHKAVLTNKRWAYKKPATPLRLLRGYGTTFSLLQLKKLPKLIEVLQ